MLVSSQHPRRLTLGFALLLPLAAFKVPDPELIYSGSAPGLVEGVTVLRDPATFAADIGPLDPDFGGDPPAFDKRAVLRIVSRPLENNCRDAELQEVSTRNMTARVRLVEKVPEKGCNCGGAERPPKAWLVTVSRLVRRAELSITDVVVPCGAASRTQQLAAGIPVLLFEGSWDATVGTEVVQDEKRFQAIVTKLNLAGRAPKIDFTQNHLVVLTGRARENSCRQTKVVSASVTTAEEASFEVEEVYGGTGQMCGQVMSLPKVFLYGVPRTVIRVKTTVKEKR